MALATHKLCTGCSACAAACSHSAIAMRADAEGFLRPQVDETKCVNCGLCERACLVLHPAEPRLPQFVYAAKAHDTELRLKSSSGGVFSLLAERTLAEGGHVFGAAFDDDLVVRHRAASNQDELAALRGSKYIQSEMGNVFQQVRDALAPKRPVLFSGTPCQVAGLRRFLDVLGLLSADVKDSLLLVETACMAVPSPKAFRRYLDSVRESFGMDPMQVCFRDKTDGWKAYSISLAFPDGRVCREAHTDNLYLRAFLTGLCNRTSCEACPARQLRSGADLTIADYWGVGSRFEDMDDDRGTSLVLVNSEKGASVFAQLTSKLDVRESDFAHASQTNPMLVKSPVASPRRSAFFRHLDSEPFESLVIRMTRPPFLSRLKVKVVKGLRALHLK